MKKMEESVERSVNTGLRAILAANLGTVPGLGVISGSVAHMGTVACTDQTAHANGKVGRSVRVGKSSRMNTCVIKGLSVSEDVFAEYSEHYGFASNNIKATGKGRN